MTTIDCSTQGITSKETQESTLKTFERLKKESALRDERMLAIQAIFLSIRECIALSTKHETLLASVYRETQDAIDQFENELYAEIAHSTPAGMDPLQTARLLQSTINDVFNETKTLPEKNKSITHFHERTNNTNYSNGMHIALGALIGAFFLATIAVICIVPFAGVSLLVGLTLLQAVSLGALIGATAGNEEVKPQHDKGTKLCENLKILSNARDRFFQSPKQPTPPIPVMNSLATSRLC